MSKITENILWAFGIIFVVMLVIPHNCSTGNNGVVSDTTRVTIYDTVKIVKPIAKDSVDIKSITERLPIADKEDNFPNKSVPEFPESVQKNPESVQKNPESGKNLQDSVQNLGKSVPDSVNVIIPITQKVYEDSTYKAYVSGFKPSLDSIFVYTSKEVLTITNKVNDKSRWSLSVSVGYGLTLTKQPTFAPVASVNLSYNIYTFPKLRKRLKKIISR